MRADLALGYEKLFDLLADGGLGGRIGGVLV